MTSTFNDPYLIVALTLPPKATFDGTRDGGRFIASADLYIIRTAWDQGLDLEAFADGYGAGSGTHGDWSGIRDSSDPAKADMLQLALAFLRKTAYERAGVPLSVQLDARPPAPARSSWTVNTLAERMRTEILADVDRVGGRVPATVRSFSQLHDLVDANKYGGLTDADCPFDAGSDADASIVNAATALVDGWLARGGLFREAQPLTRLRTVADAIVTLYDLDQPLALDYPGFISIPERIVNDATDGSDYVWCVGVGSQPGEWTGQLMTADGAQQVGNMAFVVHPIEDTPEAIASAIYCHGIGDHYIGGGCPDPDCPRVRPAGPVAPLVTPETGALLLRALKAVEQLITTESDDLGFHLRVVPISIDLVRTLRAAIAKAEGR
jgi:hypothetical protein